MSEEKTYNTVQELVASLYEDFKDTPEFIKDVSELDADTFAIRLHDGLGRSIRNEYIWKGDTKIFQECEEKGFDHADDKSHYILIQLYLYSKKRIMENEENKTDKPEENKTEQETSQNEFEGLHVLDWLKLEKEYPLAIQALKDWFLTKYDIPDVEVITEQYTMLLTNGKAGVYLNPRDLYDFFDGWDVRPFVVPEEQFPKVKYLIQSKKSFKESEEVFEERGAAEIASFIKTFFYIEVTIEHERKIEDKK